MTRVGGSSPKVRVASDRVNLWLPRDYSCFTSSAEISANGKKEIIRKVQDGEEKIIIITDE